MKSNVLKKYFNLIQFACISSLVLFASFSYAQWRTVHPMPTPRFSACAVELDGWIYLIGGKNGSESLNMVERYNPFQDVWDQTVDSLNEERANAEAVVWENEIYVIGGENNHQAVRSVERYNQNENRWETVGELQTGRSGMAAIVYQNKLIALGGVDNDGNTLSSAEYFDKTTGKWKSLSEFNLPAPGRGFMKVIAANDTMLYIIGGHYHGPVNSIQRYTPSSKWEHVSDWTHPRFNFETVILDNKLYIAGGRGYQNAHSTIEIRNLYNMNKIDEITIPHPRHDFSAAGYYNDLYLFGGREDEQGQTATNLTEVYETPTTSVKNNMTNSPQHYTLVQNVPNPMRGSTQFIIRMNRQDIQPHDNALLVVYDRLGREIWRHRTQNSNHEISIHWDGRDSQGRLVPNGVYFYRVIVSNQMIQNKLTVIR